LPSGRTILVLIVFAPFKTLQLTIFLRTLVIGTPKTSQKTRTVTSKELSEPITMEVYMSTTWYSALPAAGLVERTGNTCTLKENYHTDYMLPPPFDFALLRCHRGLGRGRSESSGLRYRHNSPDDCEASSRRDVASTTR